MDPEQQEEQIRRLAYSIWVSAGRPYWVAVEYWLMAEKMVIEFMMAANSGALVPHPSATAGDDGTHRFDVDRLAAE